MSIRIIFCLVGVENPLEDLDSHSFHALKRRLRSLDSVQIPAVREGGREREREIIYFIQTKTEHISNWLGERKINTKLSSCKAAKILIHCSFNKRGSKKRDVKVSHLTSKSKQAENIFCGFTIRPPRPNRFRKR